MVEDFSKRVDALKSNKDLDFLKGFSKEVFNLQKAIEVKDGDPLKELQQQTEGESGVLSFIEKLTSERYILLRNQISLETQKFNADKSASDKYTKQKDKLDENKKDDKEKLSKNTKNEKDAAMKKRDKSNDRKVAQKEYAQDIKDINSKHTEKFNAIEEQYDKDLDKIKDIYSQELEQLTMKYLGAIYFGFFPGEKGKAIKGMKVALNESKILSDGRTTSPYGCIDISSSDPQRNVRIWSSESKILKSYNVPQKNSLEEFNKARRVGTQVEKSEDEETDFRGNVITHNSNLKNITTISDLDIWIKRAESLKGKKFAEKPENKSAVEELSNNIALADIIKKGVGAYMAEVNTYLAIKDFKKEDDKVMEKINNFYYTAKLNSNGELVNNKTKLDKNLLRFINSEDNYTELGKRLVRYEIAEGNETSSFIAKFNKSNTEYSKIQNKEDVAALKKWIEYVKGTKKSEGNIDETLFDKLITSTQADLETEYKGKYLINGEDKIKTILELGATLKKVNEKINTSGDVVDDNTGISNETDREEVDHSNLYNNIKGIIEDHFDAFGLRKSLTIKNLKNQDVENILKCIANLDDITDLKNQYKEFQKSGSTEIGRFFEEKFVANRGDLELSDSPKREAFLIGEVSDNNYKIFAEMMNKITSSSDEIISTTIVHNNETEIDPTQTLSNFIADKESYKSAKPKELEAMMKKMIKPNYIMENEYKNIILGETDPLIISSQILLRIFKEKEDVKLMTKDEKKVFDYFMKDDKKDTSNREILFEIMNKIYPKKSKNK